MAKFRPGQSGNPGGRPKVLGEIQELARGYTKKAIETLAAIMQNEKTSPSARVAAASAILDRGYGKPQSTFAGSSEEDSLTLEDLIHMSYQVGKEGTAGGQKNSLTCADTADT
jgi:hypothetical protein